ncbi:methyltransferase [Candidatus Woesearchaeota archaeon]|jgi:putative methylase|nr:methyltransferase [Candidatus Woesearchaeota archaeon]MBT4151328.1 methyltransferase [Candidatus Woesearchaeota archaeon]MBT4247435.1 methyltransferase [Candidatus Woesearchaeota archaeon]MBT4434150.1 methyltransferase [Candidatus Woesearchaeota archaeon]MBT7332467.1 methyltransferase [Candidatus Woesearchaeota archaeon]
MVKSQRDLSRELSKLKLFEDPQFKLEQYETPPHIAADWIWEMAQRSEVAGKTILDAGCGTGILGLGLLLMGARKIYFVEKDESAMKICMENYNTLKKEYEIGEAEFILHDISIFDEQVDVVVQNPPFGTKEVHADKVFLEVAFKSTNIIYSMHKYSTAKFVEAISKDFGFTITKTWRYDFPIKAKYEFHQKPVKDIDVGLWRMEKI